VPEYRFSVGRDSFFPQPRVDAGVVSFALKRTSEYPPVASPKAFFTLVNSAFTRKRKMLRNSLQHLHSSESVQSALSSVGLPETVSFLDHQSPKGLKILNISSLGLSAQNRISAEICYKYV
jgi:16S rRNA A1518/A1519 N6-dimethyltransferase RsmA/KsgA/DIM1 with predicted DNA glycosylase/AP lyase activity